MKPSQTDIDAIARRIVATREAMGLKPADICRLTGMAPNTYSMWEGAKGRPSLDQAMLFCEATGVTLDWIYRGNRTGLPFELASKITRQTS